MYFNHYSYYKHIGYVGRGIKTNPRPKILPRWDRAPGFQIPGSATDVLLLVGRTRQARLYGFVLC